MVLTSGVQSRPGTAITPVVEIRAEGRPEVGGKTLTLGTELAERKTLGGDVVRGSDQWKRVMPSIGGRYLGQQGRRRLTRHGEGRRRETWVALLLFVTISVCPSLAAPPVASPVSYHFADQAQQGPTVAGDFVASSVVECQSHCVVSLCGEPD